MALKAIKIADQWYKPESQEGEPDPFEVLLRPLTGIQYYEVSEQCSSEKDPKSGAVLLRIPAAAVRVAWGYAVKDIRGLDGYAPARPIVDQIPDSSLLMEVALEILNRAALSEQQKKVSASPSKSPETESDSSAPDA